LSVVRTVVDENIDLFGGDPTLRVVYLIYDSSVATHQEFLVEVQAKDLYNRLAAFGLKLVHLDVTRHKDSKKICDVSKVSRKDKPTILLRADDSLH
jgi:phosphoenolpyruvate carboxylase